MISPERLEEIQGMAAEMPRPSPQAAVAALLDAVMEIARLQDEVTRLKELVTCPACGCEPDECLCACDADDWLFSHEDGS